MPKNNYEQMRNDMRSHFLDYDQIEMIRKFSLMHDDKYIYIRFLSKDYRIGRNNGIVECSDNDFLSTSEADYNESMTIYDILCCSKPDCSLSGKYALSSSLKGIIHTGWNVGGGTMFQRFSESFDKFSDRLPYACEQLGGIPEGRGDISYRIPMFDFLPVIFSFWKSDDEFPAEIKLMWDTNVLEFMHYETMWFAAGHMMLRIEERLK